MAAEATLEEAAVAISREMVRFGVVPGIADLVGSLGNAAANIRQANARQQQAELGALAEERDRALKQAELDRRFELDQAKHNASLQKQRSSAEAAGLPDFSDLKAAGRESVRAVEMLQKSQQAPNFKVGSFEAGRIGRDVDPTELGFDVGLAKNLGALTEDGGGIVHPDRVQVAQLFQQLSPLVNTEGEFADNQQMQQLAQEYLARGGDAASLSSMLQSNASRYQQDDLDAANAQRLLAEELNARVGRQAPHMQQAFEGVINNAPRTPMELFSELPMPLNTDSISAQTQAAGVGYTVSQEVKPVQDYADQYLGRPTTVAEAQALEQAIVEARVNGAPAFDALNTLTAIEGGEPLGTIYETEALATSRSSLGLQPPEPRVMIRNVLAYRERYEEPRQFRAAAALVSQFPELARAPGVLDGLVGDEPSAYMAAIENIKNSRMNNRTTVVDYARQLTNMYGLNPAMYNAPEEQRVGLHLGGAMLREAPNAVSTIANKASSTVGGAVDAVGGAIFGPGEEERAAIYHARLSTPQRALGGLAVSRDTSSTQPSAAQLREQQLQELFAAPQQPTISVDDILRMTSQ
jgi:hypothetical protein